MKGNINIKETNLNSAINTNEYLLLKEKIENLQNINLRKKLKFQKESFETIKQENQLNSNKAEFKTKNNQITENISNCKKEIHSLSDRNLQIKHNSEEMSRKIFELEAKNNKLSEDVIIFHLKFYNKIAYKVRII